jgi:flagellar basal-body rod protein FlgB
MFISNVTDRGATPALIKTLAFNEARLNMIAENIANLNTPGYRTRRLDAGAFQRSLREALDARGDDPNKPFVIGGSREVRTDANGFLGVTPSEHPVENILFHDGTNMSLERQMADLAETGMAHRLATAMLDGRFDGIRKAIRGAI